jgi:negative regulator of genetic competence, sporulation and motility
MFSECEELLRNSEKSLKHLFYEMMDEYKSSFDLFDINNIYVFELTSPLNKF